MKKLVIVSVFVLFLIVVTLLAQTQSNKVIDLILSSYTTRSFSEAPVTDVQIEQILKCGMKAPSAMNSQPWRFTVVKDMTKVKGLFRNIKSGNVVIIISTLEPAPRGINADFDCALATENMFIAAQSLELGACIYTGPLRLMDDEMRKLLELPEEYRVVALLRIGNLEEGADATSSASSRKEMKEVINYVK
jgi:nitroreductase